MIRRFAVTGGRQFADLAAVTGALNTVPHDAVLVHGAASGADALCAERWGRALRRPVEPHAADWEAPCRDTCKPGHRRTDRATGRGRSYCPAAGVYRNQAMVDSGIDLLIAFPGGTGTADMISRCEAAGVPVMQVA